jgi:hypothetical protein
VAGGALAVQRWQAQVHAVLEREVSRPSAPQAPHRLLHGTGAVRMAGPAVLGPRGGVRLVLADASMAREAIRTWRSIGSTTGVRDQMSPVREAGRALMLAAAENGSRTDAEPNRDDQGCGTRPHRVAQGEVMPGAHHGSPQR